MNNSDKNNYMIAGAVIIILIIIIILMRRKPTKPISSDPSVQVQEELNTIKERVKGIEGYTTEGRREYYRSETNNGLTIGGTIMEQMIDIIIALLKQKEVAAALQKVIQRKEDAVAIAEVIEKMGKKIRNLIRESHVLKETAPGSGAYRVDQVEMQSIATKMDQKLIEIMKSDKEKYFNLIIGIMKDNREFITTQPTMAEYNALIKRIEKDGFFDRSRRAAMSVGKSMSVGQSMSVGPSMPASGPSMSVGPSMPASAPPMPGTTVMSGTTEGYRMRY